MAPPEPTQHYFTPNPKASVRPTDVLFSVADRDFQLQASAGVFSATRLDPGTAVLLRKAQLPDPQETGPLLDLGCGYGPIACVLATVAPRATVYAVDVNTRAVELAQANATRLGLRVLAGEPSSVPTELQFAQIWSNPPIRVGKQGLHELLSGWLPRLAEAGTAWLVVARHLGADSLGEWLTALGYEVVRHASQQGFRVLRVRRNAATDAGHDAANGNSPDGGAQGAQNA